MTPQPCQSTVAPFWTPARFRTTALIAVAVLAAVEGYLAIFVRDGDFLCHRAMGTAFLAGDPYGQGNIIYPPGRSLMNVLLALGPIRPTRAVCYALALLAVVACYQGWGRLAAAAAPAPAGVTAAAALLTTGLLLAYLLRDLDECGLQLFLLFFLTAAGVALAAGRPARCGFWLATAATYKVTPVLFLPYLLWKRQWRAAAWTVAFLAAWAAAPALFVGLGTTLRCQQTWLAHTRRVAEARQAYPTQLLEPQLVYNVSLQAALARNLETYPPGHPLHVSHPLLVQPGSLGPTAAYYAVHALMLALALALAWRFRRPWSERQRPGQMASEWAVVCALCAILSPVCWKQHLVLILPALFLLARDYLTRRPASCWRLAPLLAIGAVINLTRDGLVGRDLSAVFLSYKIDTWAVLLLLGLVLTRRTAAQEGETAAAPGALAAVQPGRAA